MQPRAQPPSTADSRQGGPGRSDSAAGGDPAPDGDIWGHMCRLAGPPGPPGPPSPGGDYRSQRAGEQVVSFYECLRQWVCEDCDGDPAASVRYGPAGPAAPGPAPGHLLEARGEQWELFCYLGRTRDGRTKLRIPMQAIQMNVLCSNRVSQMTKTYDDIEAVTRLLEEKEKDLELTARIGKELLASNQRLENNVASLEGELRSAHEKLTQLNHELQKKTELIQILTNDEGDSSSEAGTPCVPKQISADLMQRKIQLLETDNIRLREEFNQIAKDTSECEAAEARLVQDITHQLYNSNHENEALLAELDKQREENRQQSEHIFALEAKLRDIEKRHTTMSAENEELRGLVRISRETQDSLSGELADLKTHHTEISALLLETQEQLKKQRKKSMPIARNTQLFPTLTGLNQHNPDSIASELESSLFSELSLDSGISTDRAPAYKKVFETVRCASRNSMNSGSSVGSSFGISPVKRLGSSGGAQASLTSSLSMSSSSGGPRMTCLPGMTPSSASGNHLSTHPAPHIYGSTLSFPSLDSTGHSDTEASISNDSESNYSMDAEQCGPRSTFSELEAAVRRLTPAEVALRRAHLGSGSLLSYDDCRTPDSIMSTGSSGAFSGNSNSMNWKLPDKLQIVKPIEGSLTLHHWTQLATPTFSGLLEERPGVKIRGGKPLEELGLDTYTLSDLEEDDEFICPGKSFQSTSSVFTYTNSTVMHPDDMTSVTHSLPPSQMSTRTTNSRQSTAPPTPISGMSRRNSTSTFSTCLGLAKMLNERGIKAVTPSALNTPSTEKSFTPTATPCNSPDGSPLGSAESSPSSSRSPSPPPYSTFPIPALLSSGAELLRRTFSSERNPSLHHHRSHSRKYKKGLSRSDRKALSSIRLVEKLERMGLEGLVTPGGNASGLYLNPAQRSPMAQLTGLKSPVGNPLKPSFVLGGDDDSDIPILGMPAKPGSGQLDSRLNRLPKLQRKPSIRTDLGSVPGATQVARVGRGRPDLGSVPTDVGSDSHSSSTLGTLSSLWFGRKGGLL